MQKRGQTEMSFGMIFSIILIVIFLGFAFYGIKTFLSFQNNAKAVAFYEDLQADVNNVWESSQSSETQEYAIPSNAESVCFVDFESDAEGSDSLIYSELRMADYGTENLVFYPVKFTGFESKEIDHLDIGETTNEDNPLCITTNNGKVTFRLKKGPGEALVTVSR